MQTAIHIGVVILTLLIATSSFGQDRDVEMVQKLPIFFEDYSCRDMVRVVNHLRSLGKDRALEVLGADRRVEDNDKIRLICRLLFKNPDGWTPFAGIFEPQVGKDAMSKFPLFPIALYDGVPFVLIKRHEFSRDELASISLEACRKLSIIQEDLSETNYEGAARKLIKSDAFKWFYIPHDAWFSMSREVMKQARR